MAKAIFCAVVLTLFVLSSFAVSAQSLAGFDKRSIVMANASNDPLEVTANITLGKEPKCIAVNAETNRVYVGVEGGLIVINGETDQVIAEISLGEDVVALAVNPQTNHIYAGVWGENVTVIDGATNLAVGAIQEGVYDSYELAINPVTNLVYIGDWTTTQNAYDSVQVYSGEDLTFITSVNIPGSNTNPTIERVGVAVNPNTNKIYATWSGNDTLYMIDGNTHTITKTAHPSSFSRTVMVNSYTNYIYVEKAVLNGENLETVIAGYAGDLMAIDPVHNFLYTANNEDLLRLNGTTHEIIDDVILDWWISSYDPVAVNPQTSKIYIAKSYDNLVCVVSAVASPSPTLSPSPSPSPTPTPTQTATPSPTPTPSPTSTPSASQSPTPSLSPSASPLTSPTPTPSSRGLFLPKEAIYAAVAVIVAVIVAVVAVVLHKRAKKNRQSPNALLPPPPPA